MCSRTLGQEEPRGSGAGQSCRGQNRLNRNPSAANPEGFSETRLSGQEDHKSSSRPVPYPAHPLRDRLVARHEVAGVHDHDGDGIPGSGIGVHHGRSFQPSNVKDVRGAYEDRQNSEWY